MGGGIGGMLKFRGFSKAAVFRMCDRAPHPRAIILHCTRPLLPFTTFRPARNPGGKNRKRALKITAFLVRYGYRFKRQLALQTPAR